MSEFLSASAINSYYRCPRAFFYKYVLKMQTPASIHLYKGSIVHKILEELFGRKTPKGMSKFVQTRLKEIWDPKKESVIISKKEDKTHKKEAELMLTNFVRRFEDKIKITMLDSKITSDVHAFHLLKPKMREEKITNETHKIVGVIDSIEENYEGIKFVVDYKTSKLFKNSVSSDYIRQLRIYALLIKERGDKPADYVGVNYLKYGETYYFPVTPETYVEALNDIKHVRESTKSLDMNDYPECKKVWCECQTLKKEVKKTLEVQISKDIPSPKKN